MVYILLNVLTFANKIYKCCAKKKKILNKLKILSDIKIL
jgi:hypothetical protein